MNPSPVQEFRVLARYFELHSKCNFIRVGFEA